jgi:glycine betaine/proline transport system ATP-binding protein
VLINEGDTPIDVGHCSKDELLRCGANESPWSFSNSRCFPGGPFADNVGLGLELRGEPAAERRKIVAEQLELVGLSQWADRARRRAVRRHAAARGSGACICDRSGHSADG